MTTWFERLMGFTEESPGQVRRHITVDGDTLVSAQNGRRVGCGRLEIPSLAEIRRTTVRSDHAGSPTVSEVVADVAALHRDPDNAGALFQAASQFNLLEMTNPNVTPEEGVGIYEYDRTQGPACAIACGGGTIYRNYFAEIEGHPGQVAERQIDCLADLGEALGQPGLWEMRNGYALANREGLEQINETLEGANDEERDALRGLLRIGVQHRVEVLETTHTVTQVYGSALPVAYGAPPTPLWEPLARLVLEASYEATLLVAQREKIERVYLTLLGGGVFGNPDEWIRDAIVRALSICGAIDVRIVSYGRSKESVREIIRNVNGLDRRDLARDS